MGLDGIEMIMAIEEAFGVELSVDEYVQAKTPRLAGDIIFSKLQATDEKLCQTQRAFYLLRKALVKRFGLKRAEITPNTEFRSLVPPEQELDFWNGLKQLAFSESKYREDAEFVKDYGLDQ